MWAQTGKASFLVGGQFGSEGKGLAAAWLAEKSCSSVDIATTNAGAQAGHTTKYADGRSFVCYHLPTVGVVRKEALCYINAGSIVDPPNLLAEVEACGVDKERVIIHPNAAVISQENRDEERAAGSSTTRLASTQKGVGSALSGKVMRRAKLAGDDEMLNDTFKIGSINLNEQMADGATVTVEVPQGFSLSINHGGFYPYCTSRDCWMGSGMNDAGIHPAYLGHTAMVVRTYPIRVGSVYNEQGELLGSSGPFYADSTELQWSQNFPRIVPERTTVTKRVRRIATWSAEQYRDALSFNRPEFVILNFVNYLRERSSSSCGAFSDPVALLDEYMEDMTQIEVSLGLYPRHLFGLGPCVEDVLYYDGAVEWLKNA